MFSWLPVNVPVTPLESVNVSVSGPGKQVGEKISPGREPR
jgi:hypothetical protein